MNRKRNVFYQRTASGEAALHSEDTAIPDDYRRILAILDGQTHVNVLRGRLRRYSDDLIADWLQELEDIGFIERIGSEEAAAEDLYSLTTSGISFGALNELLVERQYISGETQNASLALENMHAYLALDRLQNREPIRKAAEESVVLIVEDDPDHAALADLRVSMAGYRVRLARSLREMLKELVTRPPPDIILLDVMLPDGNGFDILAGLRRSQSFSLIPVILLTAITSAEGIGRALGLGADGYVTKPYSRTLLADTIRQVLQHEKTV